MKDNMTAEKVLQDPSLAHFHEAIHFMEKKERELEVGSLLIKYFFHFSHKSTN